MKYLCWEGTTRGGTTSMKEWLGTQLYLQVPVVVPAGSQFGNSTVSPPEKKVFLPLFFKVLWYLKQLSFIKWAQEVWNCLQ